MFYDVCMVRKKGKYIGFRISTEEFERLQEVVKNASETTYAGITEVIKEVLGFLPPKAVTEEHKLFLAGKIDVAQLSAGQTPKAKSEGKRASRGGT